MKRICVFCESWESGGIEAFLCNVLRHMDLSGLEIDLVAARLGESVFTQPLKERNIHFYELSGKANEAVKNHRAFRRLLSERQYDVLHLNAYQGLSLAYARLAREAGVPVRIAHSHNTDLRKSSARWLKLRLHDWGRKCCGRDCTHLWACSEMAARFLFAEKDLSEKGWRFIPNGIETERFRFDPAVRAEARAELGLSDEFLIGNVGRLCRQKNQSFLLGVLREVLEQRPDSRLLLVGEGEELPRLKEEAAALAVADKVIFYGATPHIERLYQAMDVFAFPSLFEGLGIAAVEAQCAGLPVFCSSRVPDEALATSRAERLALDTRVWANTLSGAKSGGREQAAGEVRRAGFDIADAARLVAEGWAEHG